MLFIIYIKLSMSNTYYSRPIDFNLGIYIFSAMYSLGLIGENITNMHNLL